MLLRILRKTGQCMPIKFSSGNYIKLILTAICIIFSYYLAIILHEWAHGTVAWLYGFKKAFYDVDYGGWLLSGVDENVPYDQIIASHQGAKAALIGIAGFSVSTVLFLLSLWTLKKVKLNFLSFSFFYWFSVMNMVPIIQYLSVQPFSLQGDTGRFVHGLNISPWWVFVPGVCFVCFALYQLLRRIVPKAYRIIPIKSLWTQRIFLLVSLCIMFLLIYSHGYNPLSDKGMPKIGKVFAGISMLLVPILFFLCNPSQKWVKKEIQTKKYS